MQLPIAIGLLILLSALFFVVGLVAGKRKRSFQVTGKRIEEYSFYPFVKNEAGQVEFNADMFNKAVRHFLENRDQLAAQQLIIIGEQNLVRDTLSSEDLKNYKRFYDKYGGELIISDNSEYLENYKRIVQLVGKSFPGAGIEILLHNLVNPAKSVIAIENGEVTGRKIENGTTNLVLDLKTRKLKNQDKLNYELTIGARKFKCTTIPIFRRDYGLVGAICINVDMNFLRDEIMTNQQKLTAFIENVLKTDFELDENILSKAEYKKALAGKRHFMDEVLYQEAPAPMRKRQLMAILFSDIVEFSRIMGSNEQTALEILETNRNIHSRIVKEHHGELLKEMGDGILASFHTASDAVSCAGSLLRAVKEDGKFKLRIGIHLGEIIFAGKDIFGDGVNIAYRILEAAAPNAICLSADVYNNVRNKLTLTAEPLGEQELKHINQRVNLFQLGVD